MSDDVLFDLIIIGAGPAGITATVYALRQQLNCMLLTGDIGGQATLSADIENYTGFQFISGADLSSKFAEHINKYDVDLHEGEKVVSLSKEGGVFLASTAKKVYRSKAVVVASGKVSRALDVPGEEEFRNKGVSYCATCDGPIFSGKEVAVIGGGNSALDAAIQLIRIASKVTVINISRGMTGEKLRQKKVLSSEKAEVLNGSRVTEIKGSSFVEAIVVETPEGRRDIPVNGVFVEIGLAPNSDFVQGINKNDIGEIIVNSRNETNIPGLFAAGDVTDVPEKQIIVAAGEGAKAALSAFKYIEGGDVSYDY